MVKAINYETLDASISGEDLFRELLPSSVIEIVSMYEEKKAALRRKVLADCEHKDEELEYVQSTACCSYKLSFQKVSSHTSYG